MKMQIADAVDKFIGVKDKSEIDYAKDIYRISALWLTNPQGEILIAQRSKKLKNGPLLWGPAVAGTIEEGETYESNIYKEAQEEIGVVNINFVLGPKQRVAGLRNFFCQWFTAVIDKPETDFVLQEDEVDAVQWIKASDLVKDVRANPNEYVSEMSEVLSMFVK
ncbi:MAG TPA: NUDIX domain-containing protein [Candidatus Saccharimonadales bacterium]|nr:NUDIX domain-containing protein [Candidatus Saccharimonadales bacterium]